MTKKGETEGKGQRTEMSKRKLNGLRDNEDGRETDRVTDR